MHDAMLQYGVVMEGNPPMDCDIVVPLSGGKDSQCCLKLAVMTGKKVVALFCDTQFEHPKTYAHVLDTVALYGVPLVTLTAGSVLQVCLKYKRFPGGGARHCTDELKIRPSKFFHKEYAAHIGKGFEVWLGMRSDESKEREARYRGKITDDLYEPHEVMRKYPKYLAKMGVMFKLPILDWSKSEVFEFLQDEENPLYDAGFDRVGCFPCLASGDSHKVKAFNFDDIGRKHFAIASEISEAAGRAILTTKKYGAESPGCAICSM